MDKNIYQTLLHVYLMAAQQLTGITLPQMIRRCNIQSYQFQFNNSDLNKLWVLEALSETDYLWVSF